jgi:hypothetical protein
MEAIIGADIVPNGGNRKCMMIDWPMEVFVSEKIVKEGISETVGIVESLCEV